MFRSLVVVGTGNREGTVGEESVEEVGRCGVG
jgi:hypothetical protein